MAEHVHARAGIAVTIRRVIGSGHLELGVDAATTTSSRLSRSAPGRACRPRGCHLDAGQDADGREPSFSSSTTRAEHATATATTRARRSAGASGRSARPTRARGPGGHRHLLAAGAPSDHSLCVWQSPRSAARSSAPAARAGAGRLHPAQVNGTSPRTDSVDHWSVFADAVQVTQTCP